MTDFYLRTPPKRRDNLAAGLVAGGLAVGVGAVAFYLVRLFLTREPLVHPPARRGSGKGRDLGGEEPGEASA